MKEVVITHAVRTPIGRIGGSLRDFPEKELGRLVVEELLRRAGLAGREIDHVILGHVRQSSDPANTARVVALMAGIPETVPAYTVHRQCGSGLQAIMDASQIIRAGEAEIVVAGGTENMSQSVYFIRNARHGLGNGDHAIEDSLVEGAPGAVPVEIYGRLPMGITAENLAERYGIPREEQDAFSLESQERASRAIRAGRFREQILPVAIRNPDGTTRLFDTDEHPRMTTNELLAALAPAFKKGGSVTAGNASGRNDGAAAVLVMSAEKARSLGMKPMARILASAASGCDPTVMGIAPVECTRSALSRAKLDLRDVDVIELNEAFAAQSLAVVREWVSWGVDRETLQAKLNPNGGAIALGHPLGCTGAALTVKCLYELQRVAAHRFGLITMCCAGGLGVAMVVEKGG
ncbi:MAG: thiolase family protein [Deltaproteobacteria bacterium]|nr:thiolase family protein [Deltaproteobacteria bacterium]